MLIAGTVLSSAAQAPAQAQSEGDSDATDVVVLLDVSQSVFPYFQDVTDFVVSSVVRDYLRYGDTFHLLSFGETTQTEIAQRMSTESDVKSVLGRLYLLYPLARYTDLVGALNYLYQYVADLPESRRKVIVIITDGVHNPPPSSATFGMAPEKVSAEVEAAAAKIRANGWPVHIIKLPFPKPGERGAPSPGSSEAQGRSYLDAAAAALGAKVSDFSADGKADIARKSLALPSVEFPGPLGKKDYSFSFPLKLTNGSESTVGLELDRVRFGDADILSNKVFLTLQGGRSGWMEVPVLLPDSLPQGDTKLDIRLHFANGVRVSPDTGVLQVTLDRSPIGALLRSDVGRIASLALLLILILAAILVAVLILRRMPKRAEAPVVAAVLHGEGGEAPARAGGAAAKAAEAKTALAAAAVASSANAGERSVSAAKSAKDIENSRREEAARTAALLAQAAQAAKAEAAAQGGLIAGGKRTHLKDEREIAADGSAAAMVAQRKAESERTVALLAEAAHRRVPAATPSGSRDFAATALAYSSHVVKPGSLQVELLVSEQNPHIGMRNVQTLSAGGQKSVGGGGSDFLVFLVSIPRKVAELHFDGEKLVFVPLRPELFPELKGPVEDCLGVDIPMISKSGYPLKLRFVAYEKPADKINRLLHCIETPGLTRTV